MENAKKIINAKEARQITRESPRVFNVIMRNIQDVAKMGENSYRYTAPLDEEVVESLIRKLTDLGYSVTKWKEAVLEDEYDNNMPPPLKYTEIIISW